MLLPVEAMIVHVPELQHLLRWVIGIVGLCKPSQRLHTNEPR